MTENAWLRPSRPIGAGSVQLAICDRCSAVRPRRSGSATSLRAIDVTREISEPAFGIVVATREP
jgi:hypothetical protein